MTKTEQLANIWEKKFGDEYTDRKLKVHDLEGQLRESFWRMLVKMTPDAESYLEIGCNAGMNLEGLYTANPQLNITGIEPNVYSLDVAIKKAEGRYRVRGGNIFDLPPELRSDLVFTCTVLIHIAPNDLLSALSNLYKTSKRYILIMEYYWPTVKEMEYRGLKNALWKRDYGSTFLENFSVELIETGYLDSRDGFDRVTWWLFEKQLTNNLKI
jgi:pseudaminic acid biosynthesis-associated methylase